MVSKSIIICFVIYFVFPDETPEQENLRLNNVLVEYISANTQLKKENIQLKKTVHNLQQEVAHLKSKYFKEEQMEEPTSGKGLKQFLCLHKGEHVVCRLSVVLISPQAHQTGNQSLVAPRRVCPTHSSSLKDVARSQSTARTDHWS